MPDLESALRALAAEIDWPPTPALGARLRGRVAGARPQGPASRVLLTALAAAAVLAAGAAAAGATDLALRSITIQRVQQLPPVPAPTPASRTEASLAAASRDAGFPVRAPAALGAPDAIQVLAGDRRVVTLLYRPRADLPASPVEPAIGALVTEAPVTGQVPLAGKLAGPGTRVEPVVVAGGAGLWLEGSPHEVFLYNRPDTLRLATNTLLWERDGVTYRLEAFVPRDGAIRIAESMK